MNHKRIVITFVLLISISGCTSLMSDKPLVFESSPVEVEESALNQTGFSENEVRSAVINRSVEYNGASKRVKITNHVAIYSKQADLGPLGKQKAAKFVAVSTPGASIAGQPLNPIGTMDNEELLTFASDKFGGVKDIEKVSTQKQTMLGKTSNLTEFNATATMDGKEVDIRLYIVKVQHEGDYVLGIGAHPTKLDEKENIQTLIKNINHTTAE